jgi:hypothetical protein
MYQHFSKKKKLKAIQTIQKQWKKYQKYQQMLYFAQVFYLFEKKQKQQKQQEKENFHIVKLQKWWKKLIKQKKKKKFFSKNATKIIAWWRCMYFKKKFQQHLVQLQKEKEKQQKQKQSQFSSREGSSGSFKSSGTQALTLGVRLEMALHILQHGKRLNEMLFACHTIEMCTKYSRECCFKCHEFNIERLLYSAIQGLNRSRPHVELLHQLLLVLKNLVEYQEYNTFLIQHEHDATTKTIKDKNTQDQIVDFVRAIEILTDLLHIHRDSNQIFTLSSNLLRFYLERLEIFVLQDPKIIFSDQMESKLNKIWSDTTKRIDALYELMSKKAHIYANALTHVNTTTATKTTTTTTTTSNFHTKSISHTMNATTASNGAGILQRLLKILNCSKMLSSTQQKKKPCMIHSSSNVTMQ